MKLHKYIIGAVLASAVGATFAQAQWTILDTFEGSESDRSTNDFAGWAFFQELSIDNETPPIISIDPDPAGGENNVFYYDPLGYGTVWNVSAAILPLPEPVEEGEIATVYTRFYASGTGSDLNMGVSAVAIVARDPATDESIIADGGGPVPLAAEPTQSPGNFEAQVNFFSIAGNGTLTGRDGSNWTFTDYVVPLNQWVELWMVVDNANDTVELFLRAEGETDVVALYDEPAGFRNGTEDALQTLIFNYNSGDPEGGAYAGDPIYFDDLAVNVGSRALETPGEGGEDETYLGYPVSDGYISTDAWMGMLYIGNAPWLWSYDLDGYVYAAEESHSNSGMWLYVPNLGE